MKIAMKIASNDIGSSIAGFAELGPLAGLSIQHTRPGVTPAAPSNEDRARAFREVQPVALANHFHWPFQDSASGQTPATGSLAVAGEPNDAGQERRAGNRRLSLVRVA